MTADLRALARRMGGAVVMLLALSPAVIVTAPAAQSAYTPSAATVAAYEARILYRINDVRSRYGRVRLAASYCPDAFAEARSAYLARTGYFYHQSLTPILTSCHATRAAENLARGNVSADTLFVAWMKSPGHAANIMDGRLTRIGVGAVYARGQWVVVTDFSRS